MIKKILVLAIFFISLSNIMAQNQETSTSKPLNLGAFSLSLKVKDLKTSKEFYEKLGFSVFGGKMESHYLIMKNGTTLIGLFQGFIDENALTFNPGWNTDAKEYNPYNDVREIQQSLKKDGVKLDREANETTKGPEYILLKDPDGNVIMIDQHR